MKVAQLCPTLCDPMDYAVHGILQARILAWVAFLPNPRIEPRSPTLQVETLPAKLQGKPKNIGVGKPIPSSVDLPDPGIELGPPALQEDSLPTELPGKLFL